MCIEKHVLVKKKTVYKWDKHSYTTMNLSIKKQSIEWKLTNSPVKKKFWPQWSVKKFMQTVCDMKELITIDFIEKYETIKFPIANSLC